MTAKTQAERKAAERQRRKESGQVLVQEWVHQSVAERLKKYADKLRKGTPCAS
jgi:hypothetical protein